MGKRASKLFPILRRTLPLRGLGPVSSRASAAVLIFGILGCQSVPIDPDRPMLPSVSSSGQAPEVRPPLEYQGERFQIPTHVPDAALIPIRFKFDPTRESPRDCIATNGKKKFDFVTITPGVMEAIGVVGYMESAPQVFDVECTLVPSADSESSGQKKVEVGRFTVRVDARDYPKEALRVDPSKVNPSPKDLKRIQRDSKKVGAVYRTLTPGRLWNGVWAKPEGVQTSRYGNQRTFNGELRSSHQGIDFRAPTGTEILAPASGRVALAEDLFFSGNTVILDHGLGLFTVYAHLSAFRVKMGDEIKPGRVLGLSGATGRAAGPHLHLGAVLQGVKFNPEDLFEVLR
jgi:hypothetical protein